MLPFVLATLPASSPSQAAPDAAQAAAAPAPRRPDVSFNMATFNILGSQHTAGAGGFAPGVKRAGAVARIMRKLKISVASYQEVQDDQLRVLQNKMPNFSIWPGQRLGNNGQRLQIAWDKRRFRLVRKGHINTVFDNQIRPIPYVLLFNRDSGRKFWVINVHNSPHSMEAERDAAVARQVPLIKRLRRTGHAVFFMGDMNEKEEIFCRIVGETSLEAANGGRANPCRPPAMRLYIDWIFGAGNIRFSQYRAIRNKQVKFTSDHHLIRTRVTLFGAKG